MTKINDLKPQAKQMQPVNLYPHLGKQCRGCKGLGAKCKVLNDIECLRFDLNAANAFHVATIYDLPPLTQLPDHSPTISPPFWLMQGVMLAKKWTGQSLRLHRV